jgi:hypothetical protein
MVYAVRLCLNLFICLFYMHECLRLKSTAWLAPDTETDVGIAVAMFDNEFG